MNAIAEINNSTFEVATFLLHHFSLAPLTPLRFEAISNR